MNQFTSEEIAQIRALIVGAGNRQPSLMPQGDFRIDLLLKPIVAQRAFEDRSNLFIPFPQKFDTMLMSLSGTGDEGMSVISSRPSGPITDSQVFAEVGNRAFTATEALSVILHLIAIARADSSHTHILPVLGGVVRRKFYLQRLLSGRWLIDFDDQLFTEPWPSEVVVLHKQT